MSVPIRNRSESEIDYHCDAVMADQSLIQLALRNFGVKDRIHFIMQMMIFIETLCTV